MSLVSVVIPTHNRAHLIHDALVSASNLPNARVEIIVVDDGSTDNTYEVVKSFPFPCLYVYQEQQGVGAARNLGLEHASGEFVIFLDSDDLLLPAKTVFQLPLLQSAPELGVTYSKWRTVQLADNLVLRTPGIDHTSNVLPILLHKNVAPPHACLFRTEVVRELGGFDTNLVGTEDWDLLVRLALRGRAFGFSVHVSAVYRLHHKSLSSNRERMLQNAMKLIDKTFTSKQLPEKYRCCYRLAKVINYLETVRRCLRTNDYVEAQKFLHRLFKSMPEAVRWIHPTISSTKNTSKSVPVGHLALPGGWISINDLYRQRTTLEQQIDSV